MKGGTCDKFQKKIRDGYQKKFQEKPRKRYSNSWWNANTIPGEITERISKEFPKIISVEIPDRILGKKP